MNLRERISAKSTELIDGISDASHNLAEDPKKWEKIHALDCSRVFPNPFQYRISFSPEKIEELIEGFEKDGQLQPIGVRRVGDQYQIIFGEHRWRAATKHSGKVLAIIRDATDEQMASMCFGENKVRSNPSAYEEYRAIAIQKNMGKTPKEIQATLSLRPQDYYKLASFSNFPKEVIDKIEEHLNVIGKTEAEALAKMLDDDAYDASKFSEVVIDAMDRFVHGNIDTRKVMMKQIIAKLKIKASNPAPRTQKKVETEPKSDVISFEGKPVGAISQSGSTYTLTLNKEELPQDKIQELTEFIAKFLES